MLARERCQGTRRPVLGGGAAAAATFQVEGSFSLAQRLHSPRYQITRSQAQDKRVPQLSATTTEAVGDNDDEGADKGEQADDQVDDVGRAGEGSRMVLDGRRRGRGHLTNDERSGCLRPALRTIAKDEIRCATG